MLVALPASPHASALMSFHAAITSMQHPQETHINFHSPTSGRFFDKSPKSRRFSHNCGRNSHKWVGDSSGAILHGRFLHISKIGGLVDAYRTYTCIYTHICIHIHMHTVILVACRLRILGCLTCITASVSTHQFSCRHHINATHTRNLSLVRY